MTTTLGCSPQARARGLAPVGTATAARAHVLVDIPLPWPSDLATTDRHRAVAEAAGPGVRVHGVVPAPVDADARIAPQREVPVRVVAHVAQHVAGDGTAGDGPFSDGSAGDGRFSGYRRHAVAVPAADVPAAVAALLAGEHERPGTDVLVCGHGSRDRCCGSMGTALALRTPRRPTVATWRSGHLGGHRFAPTALVLPEGTAWAWLDDALLAAVVERSLPPADLLGHYRGSTGVAHPAAQLVEGRAFAEVGWSWLDGPRTAEVVEERAAGSTGGPAGDPEWEVRVTGAGSAWRAVVREVGRVPQPVCGSTEPGPKDDPVLDLVALRPD